MATSKRSDLATRVITNTGRTDKTTTTNEGLNEALLQLSRINPFDEIRLDSTLTLASGDSSVTLPDNLLQIVEARIRSDATPTKVRPLVLLRKSDFVRKFPNVGNQTYTGFPLWGYKELLTLNLNLRADAEYKIDITYFALNRFVDDDSVSLIPDSDECLIAGATAYVYESIQMYDDAKYWWNKFYTQAQLLAQTSQREIGTTIKAEPWRNYPHQVVNEPNDPFQGLNPRAYPDEI